MTPEVVRRHRRHQPADDTKQIDTNNADKETNDIHL